MDADVLMKLITTLLSVGGSNPWLLGLLLVGGLVGFFMLKRSAAKSKFGRERREDEGGLAEDVSSGQKVDEGVEGRSDDFFKN